MLAALDLTLSVVKQGEPWLNVFIGGLFSTIGAIVVALIASNRISKRTSDVEQTWSDNFHSSREFLEDFRRETSDTLTSLRDEVTARHRVLSQALDRGVYETDADGQCLFVNQTWCRITGIPPTEALGFGWVRGLHPDDESRVRLAWKMAVASKERFGPMTYRWMRSDGTVSTVVGEAYPIRNGGGRIKGFLGVLQEVHSE